MKNYSTEKWHIIDAKGKVLGRVATKAAHLLRGKHRVNFVPHQPMGDYVIVINVSKVALTGNKKTDKLYYKHSGYLGSLRSESYDSIIERKPLFPMEHAVRGMLPKNRLGRELFRRLHVFRDERHPHNAQKPAEVDI